MSFGHLSRYRPFDLFVSKRLSRFMEHVTFYNLYLFVAHFIIFGANDIMETSNGFMISTWTSKHIEIDRAETSVTFLGKKSATAFGSV